METELTTLKRKYAESRQSYKSVRQRMREQRDRSRQLIKACVHKLQEKEAEIQKIRSHRDEELSFIARELIYLQSNMIKEQQRLEKVIQEKSALLQSQDAEMDKLRKQNKKLLLKLVTDADRDMDTPSSEDSSPKSSFSKKATPPDPPIRLRAPPSAPTEAGQLKDDPKVSKPPVPSRAAVNKKLHLGPPAVPPRSARSALTDDSGRESDDVASQNNSFENYVSNDKPNKVRFSDINSNGLPARPSAIPSSPKDMQNNFEEYLLTDLERGHSTGDEGFCSSHEENKTHYEGYLDTAGLDQTSVGHPPARPPKPANQKPALTQMTNHRAVQKPSDIKQRSRLRSVAVSNLSVLEEHQVTGDGQVTTVTYWTEPYL